ELVVEEAVLAAAALAPSVGPVGIRVRISTRPTMKPSPALVPRRRPDPNRREPRGAKCALVMSPDPSAKPATMAELRIFEQAPDPDHVFSSHRGQRWWEFGGRVATLLVRSPRPGVVAVR